MLLIGAHVAVGGDVMKALHEVKRMGGKALQIFLSNPCSVRKVDVVNWSEKQIKDVREYSEKEGIVLVVHSKYLLNLSRKVDGRNMWALRSLIDDMIVAERIGAIGCVVHMGSRGGEMSVKEAEDGMRKSVKFVLESGGVKGGKAKVILETSCAEGTKIGGNLDEMARLWKGFSGKRVKDRVGICVDTAHIFAGGHDIHKADGLKRYFKEFDKKIGLKNLSVIHLNDSSREHHSKVDKHAGLGKGYIFGKKFGGEGRLEDLLAVADKWSVPIVLETHDNYEKEIKMLYRSAKKAQIGEASGANRGVRKGSKKRTGNIKEDKPYYADDIEGMDEIENPYDFSDLYVIRALEMTGGRKGGGNEMLIRHFEKLRDFHKSFGANHIHEFNAYRKIVNILKGHSEKIKSGADVAHLEGIGKRTVDKIDEILRTGGLQLLKNVEGNKRLVAKMKLQSVMGIGPSKAMDLVRKGVFSVEDLKKAVRRGEVKLNDKQMVALKYSKDLDKRVPRSEVKKFGDEVGKVLGKGVGKVIIAGSYMYGAVDSGDIDLIVVVNKLKSKKDVMRDGANVMKDMIDKLREKGLIIETLDLGKSKFMGLGKVGKIVRHVDIRLASVDSVEAFKLYFGSGVDFSRWIRSVAKAKGYKLNEWGLEDRRSGQRIDDKTERGIFRVLGVDYVAVKNRA